MLSYPILNKLKTNIEELEKTDFLKFSRSELNEFFYSKLIHIPYCILLTNKDEFNNKKFFRARLEKTINTDIENARLANTYSYPPAVFCKKNGRANLVNSTVFYCCDSPHGAMLEVNPEEEDICYISLWESRLNVDIEGVFLHPNNVSNINDFSSVARSTNKRFLDLIDMHKFKDQLLYLKEYVCNKFSCSDDDYKITSFIANEILYEKDIAQFISYPSVKSDQAYSNFAFHTNIADNCLELRKVLRTKVNRINGFSVDFECFATIGYIENHIMKWRKPNEQDFKDFQLNNPTT